MPILESLPRLFFLDCASTSMYTTTRLLDFISFSSLCVKPSGYSPFCTHIMHSTGCGIRQQQEAAMYRWSSTGTHLPPSINIMSAALQETLSISVNVQVPFEAEKHSTHSFITLFLRGDSTAVLHETARETTVPSYVCTAMGRCTARQVLSLVVMRVHVSLD